MQIKESPHLRGVISVNIDEGIPWGGPACVELGLGLTQLQASLFSS